MDLRREAEISPGLSSLWPAWKTLFCQHTHTAQQMRTHKLWPELNERLWGVCESPFVSHHNVTPSKWCHVPGRRASCEQRSRKASGSPLLRGRLEARGRGTARPCCRAPGLSCFWEAGCGITRTALSLRSKPSWGFPPQKITDLFLKSDNKIQCGKPKQWIWPHAGSPLGSFSAITLDRAEEAIWKVLNLYFLEVASSTDCL